MVRGKELGVRWLEVWAVGVGFMRRGSGKIAALPSCGLCEITPDR